MRESKKRDIGAYIPAIHRHTEWSIKYLKYNTEKEWLGD